MDRENTIEQFKKNKLFLLFLFLISCETSNIPKGFLKIENIEPPILLDIRYSGSDNFLGRTVIGYENPKKILKYGKLNSYEKKRCTFKKSKNCF